MKFFTRLLISAALAAIGAATGHRRPYYPPPVCFTKSQRCCFRPRYCGAVYKRLKVVRKCPYKKCRDHCRVRCEKYPYYVRVRKCYPSSVRVPDCRFVRKQYYSGEYKLVKKCEYKYITKVRCSKKKVLKYRRKCRKVCHPHCVRVKAICIKYRMYRFARFCYRLKCYPIKYSGIYFKPVPYVSKYGKYHRTTEEIRKPIRKGRKALLELKH